MWCISEWTAPLPSSNPSYFRPDNFTFASLTIQWYFLNSRWFSFFWFFLTDLAPSQPSSVNHLAISPAIGIFLPPLRVELSSFFTSFPSSGSSNSLWVAEVNLVFVTPLMASTTPATTGGNWMWDNDATRTKLTSTTAQKSTDFYHVQGQWFVLKWWLLSLMKASWDSRKPSHICTGLVNPKQSEKTVRTMLWHFHFKKQQSHLNIHPNCKESNRFSATLSVLSSIQPNETHSSESYSHPAVSHQRSGWRIPSAAGLFLGSKTWQHNLPLKHLDWNHNVLPELDCCTQLSIFLNSLDVLMSHSQWCPPGPFQWQFDWGWYTEICVFWICKVTLYNNLSWTRWRVFPNAPGSASSGSSPSFHHPWVSSKVDSLWHLHSASHVQNNWGHIHSFEKKCDQCNSILLLALQTTGTENTSRGGHTWCGRDLSGSDCWWWMHQACKWLFQQLLWWFLWN